MNNGVKVHNKNHLSKWMNDGMKLRHKSLVGYRKVFDIDKKCYNGIQYDIGNTSVGVIKRY